MDCRNLTNSCKKVSAKKGGSPIPVIEVKVPAVPCPVCHGSGELDGDDCYACGGEATK